MAIYLDCYGLTDIGKKRKENQDQFLIGDLRKSLEVFQSSLSVDDHARMFGGSQGKLLIVADGMGGHAGGERASTLALDTLSTYALNSLRWFFRLEEGSDQEFVADLRAAIANCEQSIRAEGEVIPEREGMGTTLTIAYVIWPRVYVVHVGDSRCYLMRGERLWQMTRDHTMGQALIDEGVMSEEDAEKSSAGNVLWNCVGGASDDVQPHAHRAELALGDTLLLCSDGLTKHVSDDRIEELVAGSETAQIACQRLVKAANQDGGTDNITVVLARFQELDQQDETTAQAAIRLDEQSVSEEITDQRPMTGESANLL